MIEKGQHITPAIPHLRRGIAQPLCVILKMKKLLIILSVISLLTNCADSINESKIDAKSKFEVNTQPIKKEDSVNTPDIALDSSMTIEEAAKKILAGENYYRWNDSYLLSLIDSLNSNDKISRNYYFKVFNKIMDKSDGYVSEAIGVDALEYTSYHTKEFIEWSSALTIEQLDSWAYHVGIEIYLSSQSNEVEGDDMKNGENYADLLRQNCISCRTDQITRLNRFIKSTLQTVERVSK